ncbi:hypothetical protein Spb1_40190 [Planctopirus ephydatiae]|uniref:Haloacid dehalogenase-like hydrolase n=1 Tax=Planctopirus ephydatiae TaxID=2528019 RepID=A0A518GU18_9PLAN|nr:HAD family hydrolase [Planctopirus ephydatiae]QDV32071.1 hypothetical protein Spb1_40190 [Planctopirus ephydatiae]
MAKSLLQYMQMLDDPSRRWPAPPKVEEIKATPSIKPLAGLKLMAWDPYGTLIRIADGQLEPIVPQMLRMEIALDKTLKEFNMWNSMTRKPGAPWEYLWQIYQKIVEDSKLQAKVKRGETPDPNMASYWRKVLGKLEQKSYSYDESIYGDLDELSLKIAWFFQASLQGWEVSEDIARTFELSPISQTLAGDGQPFTVDQLTLGMLRKSASIATLKENWGQLSWQTGMRAISPSFWEKFAKSLQSHGLESDRVAIVSSRMPVLAAAKTWHFKTILYAVEKSGLIASNEDFRDPAKKPDRLLTNPRQILDIMA